MKRMLVIAAAVGVAVAAVVWVLLRLWGSAGPDRAERGGRAGAERSGPAAGSASGHQAVDRDPGPGSGRKGGGPDASGSPRDEEETPRQPREDAAAIVARAMDTSRPLAERRAEVKALAAVGDARSVKALMALGDEEHYLNSAAVGALGSVAGSGQRPEIAAYLGGKLAARDLKVLAAAIESYAALMGKDAVPELAEVVRRNRVRGDGFEEMVLTAAVNALGRIASAAAAPVLMEELGRSREQGWSIEYGSCVVNALGGLNTPEGREALLAYAAGLEARRPDDPLAGPHFDEKIAEARRAAGQ